MEEGGAKMRTKCLLDHTHEHLLRELVEVVRSDSYNKAERKHRFIEVLRSIKEANPSFRGFTEKWILNLFKDYRKKMDTIHKKRLSRLLFHAMRIGFLSQEKMRVYREYTNYKAGGKVIRDGTMILPISDYEEHRSPSHADIKQVIYSL
jgi:hypothetical protein